MLIHIHKMELYDRQPRKSMREREAARELRRGRRDGVLEGRDWRKTENELLDHAVESVEVALMGKLCFWVC